MDKRARQGQALHWKAHGLKEGNRRLRADCRGPAVLWKGVCSGMGQAENVLAAVYGERLQCRALSRSRESRRKSSECGFAAKLSPFRVPGRAKIMVGVASRPFGGLLGCLGTLWQIASAAAARLRAQQLERRRVTWAEDEGNLDPDGGMDD